MLRNVKLKCTLPVVLIILLGFTAVFAKGGEINRDNAMALNSFPLISSTLLDAPIDDNGVRSVKGAWNGKDAMLLYSKGDKATILNQEGVNPCLKGIVSFEYNAIASAVKGKNLVFYVIPFTSEGKEGGAARTAWMVPSKYVGDGKWHHATLRYDYSPNLAVVGVQLDQRVNESEATGPGEWMVSDIQLKRLPYPTGANLTVQAFNASEAPIIAGKPFDMVLTVSNIGRSQARNLHVSINLSSNIHRIGNPSVPSSLSSGKSCTFLWRCRPVVRNGIARGEVHLFSGKNNHALTSYWNSIIISNAPSEWSRSRGALILRAGDIRLDFPVVGMQNGRRLYAPCSLDFNHTGVWSSVAILPRLAQILSKESPESSPMTTLLWHTTRSARFSLSSRFWTVFEYFAINQERHTLTIDAKLRANRSLHLLAFRCPDLRIGEDSFGAMKNDAIFPGLEFLAANQNSSSSEYVYPPGSERWTPNPLRITSPMISLASHGMVITLTWNPNAKWNDDNEGYSAQFATPNRPMHQNNTRMALFVPTVPKWDMENGSEASKPYLLKRGQDLSLHSTVFLQKGDTALDGIRTVLHSSAYHPLFASAPRSLQQEIDLSARCFTQTLWRGIGKGWKGQDNTEPSPNAGISLELIKMALETNNSRLAPKLDRQVQEILNNFHNNRVDVNLAMWKGGVPSALSILHSGIQGEMQTQRTDGTWGFEPDTPDRERLGPRGDTNVGICSTNLRPIATYALITRNPTAVRSLFSALKAMDKFKIPAGAQVWECPLQEPDILAAANVIPEYVAGYLITGNRQYLRKAVHWAWTGVPFVYQWRYPGRVIMPGATTPVFGSSFFTWSWMGRPVQWNGLAYANSLLALAPYDHSYDWTKLAASITHCGMQEQQLHSSASLGCYPDSYHLLSNKPFGPWLNPGVIMNNLFRIKEGLFAYPNTVAIADGSERWMVTSGAPCTGNAKAGSLSIAVHPLRGLASRLIISSPSQPESIDLNGSSLPQAVTEQAEGSWWLWDAKEGVTVIQVESAKPFMLRI